MSSRVKTTRATHAPPPDLWFTKIKTNTNFIWIIQLLVFTFWLLNLDF